ncbi:MAG TPA: 4Fe-4S binding protein [Candidatus Pullichristensenella stercorigallinarum]|uniref:4Fe-4S binding protein n=1 Tax=Candidatus Pullichristensenella stercorigallinarum TaxID=2840909 RepID=A0A9D0ZK33_9FIRM|nr:4Fe-4S binding protein [Candidatus Pullichristensenella stercorigallinarum]
MAIPSQQEITRVKALGFLHNRGTDTFSARAVSKNGTMTAQQLKSLAECAEKYGNGRVAITSRLQVEMPGIHLEDVENVRQFALDAGLVIGGTGAKIRPLTACKGTTCVYGNADTQGICAQLYDRFFVGWGNVALPHKFKIAVGGCPNSCMKPSLNDFGIEAHRLPVYDLEKCRGCKKCFIAQKCPMRAIEVVEGKMRVEENLCTKCGVCIEKCPFGVTPPVTKPAFAIFVGGTWGKHTRMGTRLNRFYEREELETVLEKTLLWFKENAYVKERLGAAIDRVGVDAFEQAIASDDLLTRKEAILAAPVRERAV